MTVIDKLLESSSVTRRLFFIFALIAGVILLSPYHNYQLELSQGDHGRDLYIFQSVHEGNLPYQKCRSAHGPLMPYYYSIFYHLFGVNIQSVLLGHAVLVFLVGIAIYFVCSSFFSPIMAFNCSLWYWTFRKNEFFYTYNHIGGVFFILITLYFLFQYLKKENSLSVYLGAVSLFFLILIRPNIGAASSAAFFLSLTISDFYKNDQNKIKKFISYILIAGALFLTTSLIYWGLTHNVPQVLEPISTTYIKAARFSAIWSFPQRLWGMIIAYYNASWVGNCFGLLFLTGLLSTIFSLKKYSADKNIILAFTSLFIFYFANLGEFAASILWFRIYWALFIFIIINFFCIEFGFKYINKFIRLLLCLTLFLICLNTAVRDLKIISHHKTDKNLLSVGPNSVYLHPKQNQWLKTVKATADFINNNIEEDEEFLSFPYAPIYYFLTNRPMPTYYFSYINAKPAKEQELLNILEARRIKYIFLSNRAYRNASKRWGTFNVTYGKELSRYFEDYYEPIAQVGPFEKTPGWYLNHAVKIYKRKK